MWTIKHRTGKFHFNQLFTSFYEFSAYWLSKSWDPCHNTPMKYFAEFKFWGFGFWKKNLNFSKCFIKFRYCKSFSYFRNISSAKYFAKSRFLKSSCESEICKIWVFVRKVLISLSVSWLLLMSREKRMLFSERMLGKMYMYSEITASSSTTKRLTPWETTSHLAFFSRQWWFSECHQT